MFMSEFRVGFKRCFMYFCGCRQGALALFPLHPAVSLDVLTTLTGAN